VIFYLVPSYAPDRYLNLKMASDSAVLFAEEVQNFLAFAGAEPPKYVSMLLNLFLPTLCYFGL
jgi:hypothetical protein